MAKAWLYFDQTTSDDTLNASFNITSIAEVGTGKTTVTFDTDFAGVDYCPVGLGGNFQGDYTIFADDDVFSFKTKMFKKYIPIFVFCILVSMIPALMKTSASPFPYQNRPYPPKNPI